MRFLTALALLWTAATATALAAPAGNVGAPTDGALGFQKAVTPIMEMVTDFNVLMLWIIVPITLFVVGLLVWVMIRYNRRANPEPAKWSHNTFIEVVWTAIPVVILLFISVFSFPILYFQDTIPDGEGEVPAAEFTIKTVGYQWAWGYEYPDHGVGEYIATMVEEEDLQPGQLRNLSTDYPVVVPVNTTVRLQVTSDRVIHNWAMPAFGTKMDAIPGRLNETWFHVTEEGVYYGQCSELCGVRHAFMPIEVHVVSREAFDAWIAAGPGAEESNAVIAEYRASRDTQLAQLD